MRKFAAVLFSVSAVALAQPSSAFAQAAAVTQVRYGLEQNRLSAITDWLKADVASGRVPGAVVLVARDGKILLHEAVGWADKDKKIPMTRGSIHPIASSTKLITTIAALRLIEQNKIRIFAPISTYLPELKNVKVSVEKRDSAGAVTTELVNPVRPPNVHDLFTHRAGFTYYFFPKNPLRDQYRELGIDRIDTLNADEMLQKLGTLPLAFQPGTSFEYSIATDLLGHIIERVTKKPLDVALKELVLDPLKMRDTSFHVQGDAMKRFARPASNDPDLWVFDWLNVTKAPKRFSGGAGMASTAADYYRLLQMIVNDGVLDGVRLLSPMTVNWSLANHIGTQRGVAHPGDCYSWSLFNPVRVCDGAAGFPGSIGDFQWGGITGPRYFVDPKERLIGIVFMQGPSQRAAYQAELRAMVYGAFASAR
ncbi:MAG TPA: serine hydrolase domain-containing protein [Xanthobacteraceae bacterium]|nr:serine hydrolase domain-containing protein [Xanthobacteraceae bacterium]